MEDAQGFGLVSTKGAHAVLPCGIGKGKVSWHKTDKIDRRRLAQAQKIINISAVPSSRKYPSQQ